MNSLNEAFESLDKIYEGYNIDTYSELEAEEIKKAQEEFKELNTVGTLNYDVFHKAYDAALKQNAAGLIDQIFDDEGKLKGKYVYGAIKRIYPESLGRAVKQLWALAFVDNVVANRQEYADKKKAEREQRKAEDKARRERYKAGYKAYEEAKILSEQEYKETHAKLRADEETQTAKIVAAAEKAFSEDFKKQYLEACGKAGLKDCIEVNLEYNPKITIVGLKESANYNNYVLENKVYTFESKSPLRIEYTHKTEDGLDYCTTQGTSLMVTRYSYDEAAGAGEIFSAAELQKVFDEFETETQAVIDEVTRMSQYKTVFTVEELLEGMPQQKAISEFVKHHDVSVIYVGLENGTIFKAYPKMDHNPELNLKKEDVVLLNETKVKEVYAIYYDFKGGSGTYGNDPHGSYWADENWKVALNNNIPSSLRSSLNVDREATFGSVGGTEVKPKSDEAELGFDHYFEMEYVIDTSG